MRVFARAFCVFVLAGLGGIQPVWAEDEPRTCMFARNVDDYHVIDRNHVVLIDRSRETFLLGTMHPGCWEMRHSYAIGLEDNSTSICEGQTVTLLVRGERCYVRRLEAVSSAEEAENLVEQRAAEAESGDE